MAGGASDITRAAPRPVPPASPAGPAVRREARVRPARRTTHGAPLPDPAAFTNGVVTPHASFLALPYAPGEAVANLLAPARDFGAYDEGYGFRDSVNVSTGRVSDFVLALDQGMIAAALAQALRPGLLQRPFRTGGFRSRVRPLLTRERFSI